MATGKIWPNFFIVGAARAGTTSLYQYLRRVPGIYLSPVKEPRYFCRASEPASYAPAAIQSEARYLKLFKGVKNETAVGEASPQYLCDPEAAGLIHAAAPDGRIVMILRDPIERAFSHCALHHRMGVQPLPVDEALKLDFYLRHGRYARPVETYLDLFGFERVKILIFEEFIQATKRSVEDVVKFLGIDAEPPDSTGEIHNASAQPRGQLLGMIYRNHSLRAAVRALLSDRLRRSAREKVLLKRTGKPPMPHEIRRFLEETYRDDVAKLEKILGRSLPWFHGGTPPG